MWKVSRFLGGFFPKAKTEELRESERRVMMSRRMVFWRGPRLSGAEGVALFLFSDVGIRSVAGKDSNVVRQDVKVFADGVE